MCSELDDKTNPSTKPSVSNNKHITFEQQTNDGMSESEDDDIGSEELMCNENIDVNDKESDDSDEEELTNRVFPQQRFSPVPFAGRRSQTPDLGKIRYSPIEFPAKRAVTPNIYEQMASKNHSHDISGKGASKVVDFSFRAPKGLPHSNKSMDRTTETAKSQNSQFVRPKLPMAKSYSPGLTVSGYFQPTGSVFRPSQPSSGAASSKNVLNTSESTSKVDVSTSDVSQSSFSQPVLFPSNFTKYSPATNLPSTSYAAHGSQVKPYRGSSHAGLVPSTNQTVKVIDSAQKVPVIGEDETKQSHAAGSVSTSVPLATQVAWAGASDSSFLSPLTVSVATHASPPFHKNTKTTLALSPVAKGVQLKSIAPMLSPPLLASSPSGEKPSQRVLLAKKPAGHPAGKMVDVKQGCPSHKGLGYCNISPAELHTSTPPLPNPPKTPLGSFSRQAHVGSSNVPPRPAPLSPKGPSPCASLLSPKGGEGIHEISSAPGHSSSLRQPSKPLPDNCERQANLDRNDAPTTHQIGKPILKRFIADGMEEVLSEVNFERQFAELPEYSPYHRQAREGRLTNNKRGVLTSNTPNADDPGSQSSMSQERSSSGVSSSEESVHGAGLRTTSMPSLDALAEVAVLEHGLKDADREDKAEPGSPTLSPHKKPVDQRRAVILQLFHDHGYFPSDAVTTICQQRHTDLFQTKGTLQLKIREVRQKIMHKSGGGNSNTWS